MSMFYEESAKPITTNLCVTFKLNIYLPGEKETLLEAWKLLSHKDAFPTWKFHIYI